MKKIFLPMLTLLLLCGLVLTVSAATPAEPVIHTQFPDCSVPAGSDLLLFSDASSPDGGTLEYLWYSTTVEEMATIRAIDGAEGATYQVPDFSGTKWFCYAVWNVNSNGEKSAPVYSRLIRVERYDEVAAVSIDILRTPDKVVYTSGECLDLTGLKVRIWTSDGYIDSVNGDKLEITKNPLVTVGEQKIKVSYKDAFGFFIVTVKAAPHTHSFGKWMVTTEPTCTKSGIKTRECDCGYTERAEVPAAGHQWDEGKITKEPTGDSDGEKTFTCTVCKETKKEVLKAVEMVSDPSEEPDASESSENTISVEESDTSGSNEESKASGELQPSDTEPSSGFPWWIIGIVIIAIAIGTGITLFLINNVY